MAAVSGVMSAWSSYHDQQTETHTMVDSFYENDDDDEQRFHK